MTKNLFSFFLFLIIIFFFYFVFSQYISENNKKKTNIDRTNIDKIISDQVHNIPLLKNDTEDIIIYNNGFNNIDNLKPKREFWKLFKK